MRLKGGYLETLEYVFNENTSIILQDVYICEKKNKSIQVQYNIDDFHPYILHMSGKKKGMDGYLHKSNVVIFFLHIFLILYNFF